ncbi:RagB/SusD family nutrient uptake outer membrane protein [Maribellus sp. YY47]|uniref:RagB/SusD family nutrient uptake outer membrane protein n=1 Tax=Maribellus sp. YY47 TaxID=2929486 RepID=UPI0020018374|nr:RagB/SusD family nutrient uptake outer membrane protein [Maribellus sp. YY47]MCK3684385.1 RagB/SusD family nutrient uptake outer membrane protein [Maribellus sp. YY47]
MNNLFRINNMETGTKFNVSHQKPESAEKGDNCHLKRRKISRYSLPGIFLILFFSITSCSDFLSIDNYFSDELKLDSIFAQTRYVEAYMWATSALFPDEGNLFNGNHTPGPLATDEAFTGFLTRYSYNGMRFVLGEITAGSMYSFNTWDTYYKIIRKCNTIFARIDEAKDMTTKERFEILGTTRFIRAYAYYNIIVDFGPPILLEDEIVESNEPLSYYDRERSTYDEAMEYICSELETAADFLPASTAIMDFGRPTKGAAYGLVARLRLIHASPLYNGGDVARSVFGGWKRESDGADYISQSYDEKRWAVAAAAAKRVMDLESAGGIMYRLHTVEADADTPPLPEGVTSDPNYYKTWPEGAAGIDPLRSYSEMFTGESVIATNPEYVWGRKSGATVSNTQMSFPQKLSGWNGLCVTQKVVDAYSMIDGRSISNSSTEYPYSESGFSSGVQTFSGYRLNAGVSNMYVNREMRFYASVGFSECYWPMTSSTSSGYYNQTIAYYYDSPNGKGGVSSPNDFPITGYVIKKFIHPSDSWGGTNARRMDKAFPIIRYSEILLSYAEALNNLTSSYTIETGDQSQTFQRDPEEIKNAFNPIRYRAGLPGITGTEDAQTIQNLIEKERMVEFLFENRRYYDVRRWGIYEETESEPIKGMNVEGSKDVYYNKVIPNTSRIGARIVNKRLTLLPIPLNEVRIIPSLSQNPGWEQ